MSIRSKVGGNSGSERFGSTSFGQNPFTYMYAHNSHMTLGPKRICHKEEFCFVIVKLVCLSWTNRPRNG